jgi:hypothetical protein
VPNARRSALGQIFDMKMGSAQLGRNFDINIGRAALGRDFDVNIGKAACETCSAMRNLDTD